MSPSETDLVSDKPSVTSNFRAVGVCGVPVSRPIAGRVPYVRR